MIRAKSIDTGAILEETAVLLTDDEWRQRVVERMVPSQQICKRFDTKAVPEPSLPSTE